MEEKDLVIIGAGPAGLTAGIYAVRSELDTVVIEAQLPGGQIATAHKVKNYLGFPDISGMEFAEQMKTHAEAAGVTINTLEQVKKLERNGAGVIVTTTKGQYSAKTVIIATGRTYKKLGVEGEKEFFGRGVSYCPTCDGPLYRGRRTVVIGRGNHAVTSALYLADIASEVKLITDRDHFATTKSNEKQLAESKVEILTNTETLGFYGDDMVKGVKVADAATKEERTIDTDGIFVEAGRLPNTDVLEGLDVDTDVEGYIIVDENQQTNIPGLYAAGDVCVGKVKQVGVAVGHATIAALAARDYIKDTK